jgi:hypothetical protein
MLESWRVWGFLRSAGQLTTAASCRVISCLSCMPCKASSTRSAPLGSLNFSTDSVAKTPSSFFSLWMHGAMYYILGLVICVLHQRVREQPGRPIVGVLSLLCSTISSFLSRLSLLRVSLSAGIMPWCTARRRRRVRPHTRGWVASIHRESEKGSARKLGFRPTGFSET